MKTLEGKSSDQNDENGKRENPPFTSTVITAGISRKNQIGTYALTSRWTVWFVSAD